MFDALYLARLQFAFTVSFHFIFPAFSIGLASFLHSDHTRLHDLGLLGVQREDQ